MNGGGASQANSYFGMGESLAGGIIGLITAKKGPQVPSRDPAQETATYRKLREKWSERDWAQNLSEAYRNPVLTEAALSSYLLGGPARSLNVQYSTPKRTAAGQWVDRTYNRTVNIPESRGLLNILGQDVLPAMDEMSLASAERMGAGNLALLQAYGPEAVEAYRQTWAPDRLALRNELVGQTLGELRAGAGLDPSLAREYIQAVRGAQAARGMGVGPTDIYQEAYTLGSAGEARRQQRQSNAANVLALLESMDPNVAALLLGQGGQLGGAQQFVMGAYGPAMAQPAYSSLEPGAFMGDVFDFNANAAATNAIAKYNAMMGLSNALMESGQSRMGSGGGPGSMFGGGGS